MRLACGNTTLGTKPHATSRHLRLASLHCDYISLTGWDMRPKLQEEHAGTSSSSPDTHSYQVQEVGAFLSSQLAPCSHQLCLATSPQKILRHCNKAPRKTTPLPSTFPRRPSTAIPPPPLLQISPHRASRTIVRPRAPCNAGCTGVRLRRRQPPGDHHALVVEYPVAHDCPCQLNFAKHENCGHEGAAYWVARPTRDSHVRYIV